MCLFLLLFPLPWETDPQKWCYDLCQRVFYLCFLILLLSVYAKKKKKLIWKYTCIPVFLAQSLYSAWLFCDPMDYSLPGSSIHGIFQARILGWVAISYSRASSWPRDQTHVSYTGRQILYHCHLGSSHPNVYINSSIIYNCQDMERT